MDILILPIVHVNFFIIMDTESATYMDYSVRVIIMFSDMY